MSLHDAVRQGMSVAGQWNREAEGEGCLKPRHAFAGFSTVPLSEIDGQAPSTLSPATDHCNAVKYSLVMLLLLLLLLVVVSVVVAVDVVVGAVMGVVVVGVVLVAAFRSCSASSSSSVRRSVGSMSV